MQSHKPKVNLQKIEWDKRKRRKVKIRDVASPRLSKKRPREQQVVGGLDRSKYGIDQLNAMGEATPTVLGLDEEL